MGIASVDALFEALLKARSANEIREVLTSVGDHPDVGPDEKFGPLGLRWHAFGNTLSNISTVGLGTKPGRSLAERLTNAMDAVLEAHVPPGAGQLPDSCRQAAKQWLGRPVSGPNTGLFDWKYDEGEYDRMINVVILGSGSEQSPTVDVLDKGIGVAAKDFATTILSLQGGNKLSKRYLMGAFGQGGAATLAFAEYVVILSRQKSAPSQVGFTVIRVLSLDNQFKEDAYGYLTVDAGEGVGAVPSVTRDGPLVLYTGETGLKHVPTFEYGTLVRHVAYQLPGLSGILGPGEGNLYHYLHTSLFDPLIPFRLIDLRHLDKAKDEIVRGNRNRLMGRYLKKQQQEESGEEKESRIDIRLHRPMEYVQPHGSTTPTLGVEFWVVLAYKKIKGKDKEKDVLQLRPASNELYAIKGHPILGTLNGQNQGELTARLIRDAGLGMVAKHIVVHVDASRAESKVRRQLFSTNREGFKDGPILRELESFLAVMLKEDKDLQAIEKELTERLTKRDTEETSKVVKDQIRQLLAEHGLQVLDDGSTTGKGAGAVQVVAEPKKRVYQAAAPLPTLPFPDVTRFEIVSPKPEMRVRIDDHEVVLVETDADAEYGRQNRLAIRSEPPVLEQFGMAPLSGGRVRWRLRPIAGTTVGVKGTVVTTLTKPDGTQLTSSVPFEVLAPREEPAKKEKGKVPPFDIYPISPEQAEDWARMWPELSEDGVPDEKLQAVAYKAEFAGGRTIVWYSTIFGPFAATMQKLKNESPNLAALFESNYQVWIGYHAILQQNAPAFAKVDGLEEDSLERLKDGDRALVATMQVKQALQTARLKAQMLKAEEQAVE